MAPERADVREWLRQLQLSVAPQAEPIVIGDQSDGAELLGGVDTNEDVDRRPFCIPDERVRSRAPSAAG